MRIGERIANRYLVRALAGSGGMGKVYRALDESSGDDVAIKVLSLDASKYSKRFLREAEVMAQLHHKNIVGYVDYGQTERGAPYIVMEWVTGEDLRQRMNRKTLQLQEALNIIAGVGEALHFAHQRGVIHRDLKPSNLMLVDKNIDYIKLLDFGIARWRGPSVEVMTRTGISIGTPGYMAPEQSRGDSSIDGRADLYALGCVIYECLLGYRPPVDHNPEPLHGGESDPEPPRVSDKRGDISAEFDDLLADMMSADAARRPLNGTILSERARQISSATKSHSHSSQRPPALSTTEREFLCTLALALCDDVSPEDDRDLGQVIQRAGGQCQRLEGGNRLARFRGEGRHASEMVAQAARCALDLRALFPKSSIALTSAYGEYASQRSIAHAIGRTTELADQQTGAAEAQGQGRGHGVGIDETTARLVGSSFVVCRSRPNEAGVVFLTLQRLREEHEARDESADDNVPSLIASSANRAQERLRTLGAGPRRLLRAASVFLGEDTTMSAIRNLLGASKECAETEASLSVLLRHNILLAVPMSEHAGQPQRYRFESEHCRVAAYSLLTDSDRILGHRLAARCLYDAGERDAARLAAHFDHGNEKPVAAEWYALAAQQALARNALDKGRSLAERGIAIGATGRPLGILHSCMTQALLWTGDNGSASEHCTFAMETLRVGSGDWARVALDGVTALGRCGAITDICEIGEELRDASNVRGLTGALAAALARAASMLYRSGHDQEAAPLVLVLPTTLHEWKSSEPLAVAHMLAAQADRALCSRDYERGIALSKQSAADFETCGDSRSAALTRVGQGFAYSELGDFAAAEQTLRAALACASDMAVDAITALARHRLGIVLCKIGSLSESQELLTVAIASFDAQGDDRMANASRVYLSMALQEQGDLQAAHSTVLLALQGTSTATSIRMLARAQLASLLLAMGRAEQALAAAQEAATSLDALRPTQEGECFVQLALVEASNACNDSNSARLTLAGAHEGLIRRQQTIRNPSWKTSFVEQVRENAKLIELASAYGLVHKP